MNTTARSPRSSGRDDARSRVRASRRFHPAEVASDGGQPPTQDADLEQWPGPDRPSRPDDNHLQWPYWIVLLVPWLTLTAAFLLEHFKVCLICLPVSGVSLP